MSKAVYLDETLSTLENTNVLTAKILDDTQPLSALIFVTSSLLPIIEFHSAVLKSSVSISEINLVAKWFKLLNQLVDLTGVEVLGQDQNQVERTLTLTLSCAGIHKPVLGT